MITEIDLKNFGPLNSICWKGTNKINLIIGKNGSGKTFLLKSIYCALRTLEEYKRGNELRKVGEILVEKLYWTFQSEKIGDLVSRGQEGKLDFIMKIDGKSFSFDFGKDSTRQINTIENHVAPREENSVFLPAKEILSLHNIILKSRDQDRVFGFDDTYYDLARALQQPKTQGRMSEQFSSSRTDLESIIGGRVEFDDKNGRWQYIRARNRFSLGVTAEGFKKIAILDTLLGNRYISQNSVILIDEVESALHPKAISDFLDIVVKLAARGVQFFIASHSYFVVKKLFLIAQKNDWDIPVICNDDDTWAYENLKDGMPKNSIIQESIRLFEEEVEHAL
jgi:energy-coupling factor transporter ATP-binding protein EcfA2